jgi:hypothetical protein
MLRNMPRLQSFQQRLWQQLAAAELPAVAGAVGCGAEGQDVGQGLGPAQQAALQAALQAGIKAE